MKKAVVLTCLLGAAVATQGLAATGPVNNFNTSTLPQIGTAGAEVLSLEQEDRYGELYMRLVRGQGKVFYEPLVTEYLEELGYRLVAEADANSDFSFFVIRDPAINAFAFFGGHVGIHTGLITAARNESELAGVVAHEITHVTQRHLARAMSMRKRQGTATTAATVGSLLLALAAPHAGIAALQATFATSIQASINYTRSNEEEADRIGMDILYRAGFDPQGVPDFFEKLNEQYRYSSKPPEMLLTHPLTESRIADARGRVANYPRGGDKDSLNFHLMKSLMASQTGTSAAIQLRDAEKLLLEGSRYPDAAKYQKAIALLRQKKADEAAPILDELLKKDQDNPFYNVLRSDIYLAQEQPEQAVTLISRATETIPSSRALFFHKVRILHDAGQVQQSISLLENWRWDHPDDVLSLRLLAKYFGELNKPAQAHFYRAEMLFQMGRYQTAIDQFQIALQQMQNDPLEQERIKARIQQVESVLNEVRKLS